MYIAKRDMEILRTLRSLKEAYLEKFGEAFIHFNYADFHGTKEVPAAQVYKKALEEALAKNEPTRITSKDKGWRER